ncbi:transglutaminaseTgpA domain-containing protein [Nocardioides zhouii]|uniref:Transglutaminase domain-containing protein n=1 Tax=Nocardioides zhouii TaxID=1168729 RepID=A0A4Q2SZR4_9ACTN|nr:transglutaminase domain-containing protein [Nocardioides zhouii]RYC11061.1 transglutaminase domain-containing protein [Nocardioides zhouii]
MNPFTRPSLTEPGTTQVTLGQRGRRVPGVELVDVIAMLVLLGTGVLAFGPVFADVSGYVAAGGGVLVGSLLAVLGAWRRWSVFGVAAATLAAFVVFGGPLALPSTTIGGVVPTPETVNRLLVLTYQAWRDLLTVSVPASSFTGPAVVPYLSGLVCAVVALTLALRARRHLWALAPALALLLVGILWGTKSAPSAAAQGAVFCVVALAWAGWRTALQQHRDNAHLLTSRRTNTGAQRQRLMAAAVILAVAGGASVVLGGGMVSAADRYVLRDDVVPPLDLRTYASPLTSYRYYERNLKEKTLFTVTGLPEGSRLRVATMDGYDGHVYSVDAASAQFRRVGDRIGVEAPAGARTVGVEIGDYKGYWIPGGGDVGSVEFSGSRAANLAASLYYNADSGTLLSTAGLRGGETYDVTLVPDAVPSDDELAEDSIATEVGDVPVEVPDAIAGITSDFVEPGESQIDQLRLLESRFQETGFYSNDGKISAAGHFDGRLTKLFSGARMIGDDEQYATSMALMVRQLGYPARVVLGFYPEEAGGSSPVALTGNDAHVWVEVPFEDAGWVVFDPTPDRDKTPDTKVPKPDEVPQPQVLPPPVPPEEPVDPPDDRTDDSSTTKKDEKDPTIPEGVKIAGYVIGGGTLLALPFVAIALLKKRRRLRRRHTGRTADRISGGWDEVVDTARDLGVTTPTRATRQESARDLAESFAAAGPVAVAERMDAHVFGQGEPSAGDVDEMWRQVDELRTGMTRSVHPVRRVRAAFSLKSLARHRRVRNTP